MLKEMNKILMVFVIAAVLMVVFLVFAKSNLIPVGIKRTFHIMTMPADLFEPILKDKFLFWKKGFSKTYKLSPKYSDIYAVGFICENEKIPSGWGKKGGKYRFMGLIQANFYWKNKKIFTETIENHVSGFYVKGDMNYYREIEFINFEIPLKGKYKKDISLELTVIEPDEYLRQFENSIKLYVGVSGRK
ncbi:MAG: hypothetical protein KKH34_01020 [Candidatus Omnitrophica bacterium]|nr:hypothetical protein [Candidatus Omnitrophota bacterium]